MSLISNIWSPTKSFGFDDERIALLVRTVLIMTLVLSLTASVAGIVVAGGRPNGIGIAGVIILLELVAIAVLQAGYVHTAAWLMSGFIWIGMSAVSIRLGGVGDSMISLLIVVIIIASLTTGSRGNLLFTVLSMLMFSGLYLFDPYIDSFTGALAYNRFNVWITGMTAVIGAGVFIHVAMTSLYRAVKEAQTKEHDLILALEELQHTTVSNVYVESILNSISDMLVVLDEDLNIETANRAIVHSLGYDSEDDLIGKSYQDLISSENFPLLAQMMRMIVEPEYTTHATSTYVTKDGTNFPVYVSVNHMEGAAGGRRLVCVAQDITDRIASERRLKEERTLLRTLIDSMPDIVYVKNLDMKFVLGNTRFNERFGLPPDSTALIGRHAAEIEAPELIPFILDEDRRVLAGETILNQPIRTTVPDGEIRDMLLSKLPLRDESSSEITGILSVIRDVTEQVRVERELAQERTLLRTLIDSLPDYVHVKDTNGHYILSNRAHMELLDVEDQEDVVGKTLRDFFDDKHASMFSKDDQHILETGQPLLGVERSVSVQKDNDIWFLFNKVPLIQDGELTGIVSIATDITERRNHEERLQQSEARLRTVVQNAPVFIFAIDDDHNLEFFEGQGATSADMVRVSHALSGTIISTDTADLNIAGGVAAAMAGESVQTTVIMDGLAFDIRYSPVIDAEGDVSGVIGVATNITERVQVEAALRESEARNRALLDALPDMMFVIDKNGQYVEVKSDSHHGLVTPSSDLIGMNISDVFNGDILTRAQEIIRHCLHTGEIQTLDYALNTPRGPGYFEARFARLNANEVISIVRNITDKHQAAIEIRQREQTYRTLARNLPHTSVGLFDEDLRFLVAEGNPLVITGHKPEKIEGNTLYDVIPPEKQQQVEVGYREALRGRTLRFEVEIEKHHYATTIVPIRNDDGDIFAGMSVTLDVTEDRHQQEELRQYATALERSNRELQDFAYVASHDLQEPLRKIQAFGGRLASHAEDQLDETSLDYLERMQNAAERMQSLIQDLLAFSRVTTRAKPFKPVDLQDVMDGVLTDLEIVIENNDAVITVDPLPTIDAEVLQMRQLFQNLISNALKYRHNDRTPVIHVRVQLFNIENGEKKVKISVEDNGIGFDKQHADRIFGLFQRLHNRRQYQGTGMGLAICRKIVERHNGAIHARAIPNEGSTFTLILPVRQTTRHLTIQET